MNLKTCILFVLGMLTFHLAGAQNVGKRVERRAKNRVESRANQEVDRTVDKALDNVIGELFGKKKKKPAEKTDAGQSEKETADSVPEADSETYDEAEAQRRTQETIARMIGGSEEGDWEPVKNDFPISFDMTLTSEGKKETSTTSIKYTFDTWLLGMQMQQEGKAEEMRLIMDNETGTMTTVMENDGKRQGFRMRRPAIEPESFVDEADDIKINPTGNTKMIDGYFCREYLIESKEGTTHAWLTKEIQADFTQLLGSLSMASKNKAKSQDNKLLRFKEYGMLLESTSVMDTGRGPETTHTRITNIKTGDQIDRSILELADVEIMGIGN